LGLLEVDDKDVDGDKSKYKDIEVSVLKKKICMFVGD